jgi:ferredoxin-thioredoxin reductase catalytic subunit
MENFDKKRIEELIKKSEEYANKQGFKLNPDRRIVEGTVKGLLFNEKKYGALYCPCRRVTENKEEDEKIICPCIYHEDEIKKMGHCHCRLFLRR